MVEVVEVVEMVQSIVNRDRPVPMLLSTGGHVIYVSQDSLVKTV